VSLRARLVIVVGLAAVALIAAVTAITHVLTSTEAARWARADDSAATMVAAYADALKDGNPSQSARAVLSHVTDADVGRCDATGAVTVDASSRQPKPVPAGPRDRSQLGSIPPLPPDQMDEVARLCGAGDNATGRIEHPNDLLAIAVRAIDEEHRVWSIRRVARIADPEAQRWHLDALVLAGAAIALVIVTLSAMLALGRGVRMLEGSLVQLERDPRATTSLPPAKELATIGNGLRAMAAHLADAHERAQQLTLDVAQGERLRSLGRVSAGIAHEVRNPLAGIKLQLDVLDRSAELAPAAHDAVRTCLHEIGRLDRLVGALLQVAKHPPERNVRVDLNEVASRRVALAQPAATLRDIRVDVVGSGSAFADPDALAQIVDNLLHNAIEASPTGSNVSVDIDDNQITVTDRGLGVANEHAGKLFEPFHTTKPDGTGLGLWMSRALTEAQGGTLRYARRDGTTRFEVILATDGR
jgi:signal transduction histidine kinase